MTAEGADVHMAVDIGRMSAVAYDTPQAVHAVHSEARLLGRPGDVAAHLAALDAWLGPLVAAVRPRRLYVERHTGRGKGSRTLDSYTGAILAIAARHGIPADASVTALSSRKLGIGKGIGNKDAAGMVARRLLDIPDEATPDEVDARILLAAIPGHLAMARAKAEAKRLRTNALAKARRKADRAARAALSFPQVAA